MSLHPSDEWSIPAETVHAAWSALPKGNVYLRMRDALGVVYHDGDFAELFGQRGRPAEAPWRLALVSIMQFAEGLTDRQAAEAVATRLDWKYVLGLAVTAPSFHYSVLSEFRDRVLAGRAEQKLLDLMLARFGELDLIRQRGRQRTDSTHILAAVRVLNRLELVGETLRDALEALAAVASEWLLRQVSADWFDRYSYRFEQFRLPKGKAERQVLAETIGRDGYHLLQAVDGPDSPPALSQLAAVQMLRRVWIQQYYLEAAHVHWREVGNLPPAALMIESLHDPQAHYSEKRTSAWVGYKTHLTETCDDDRPHLIVNVETTGSTQPDVTMTNILHAHLAQRGLLPGEHLLDAGYVDADNLASAQLDFGVDLVGPAALDTTWQAQAHPEFALACFAVNWQAQRVTCPQGKASRYWSSSHDLYGNEVIHVQFPTADCQACPVRSQCTQSAGGPRTLKLRPQAQHEALRRARERQTTAAFKATYAKRAGVEGTISQATDAYDLRQARYIGLAKTHLQNIVTALAINVARVVAWLAGQPLAHTRKSKFAALRPKWMQSAWHPSPGTAT